MYRVEISEKGSSRVLFCNSGDILSDVLMKNGIVTPHPCGGNGKCGKCRVIVDGESVLSCRYYVRKDISVLLPHADSVMSCTGLSMTGVMTENVSLALDIGTTTIALALVSVDKKFIIDIVTGDNPQKSFGADVMSRIDFCRKNGITVLHDCVVSAVNTLIEQLLDSFNIATVDKIYVAGNTAMLHMFFGVDCSSMGVSPYTPAFLEGKSVPAEKADIRRVNTVISLPCISAFVGADIVAGLNFTGMPCQGKYNILVDLGTNAEVVLYSAGRLICTAAAAGPCFEGANISCGMSASDGAICSYVYGEQPVTVGDSVPKGICATGLIDIIAQMLQNGIIDETGYMQNEAFEAAENVYLTGGDVRNFQLAKSAVYSAVITLMRKAKISFRDIDTFFVSGGFASKMNIGNAVSVGLLPMEAFSRYSTLNNSSLAGTVKYILEHNELSVYTENAVYEDLSADADFSELFMENMMFSFFE